MLVPSASWRVMQRSRIINNKITTDLLFMMIPSFLLQLSSPPKNPHYTIFLQKKEHANFVAAIMARCALWSFYALNFPHFFLDRAFDLEHGEYRKGLCERDVEKGEELFALAWLV